MTYHDSLIAIYLALTIGLCAGIVIGYAIRHRRAEKEEQAQVEWIYEHGQVGEEYYDLDVPPIMQEQED